MKNFFVKSLEKRAKSDLLILPFWEGGKEAASFQSLKNFYHPLLKSGDFKAKVGETFFLYVEGQKEPRLLLIGLGQKEKVTPEALRRGYANSIRAARAKKAKRISLILAEDKKISKKEVFSTVAEAVFLTNYTFDSLKGDSLKESPSVLVKEIEWIGVDPKEEKTLERIFKISSGVHLVRELVNGNADEITPKKLADTALSFQKEFPKLKTTIFDKKKLEKEKMGLLLAVGRGSNLDPYFIQVSYRGNPSSKEHVVLIGKGITYDTGGLNLKLGDGMLTMKCDMAGAAAVLGTIRTVAALNLKVNVTALVPTAENSIDGKSFKMGDVYTSYSGKTVEVNNTDAEGRLVLADAISFAIKNLHPTSIIDLATLTGGVVIALGEQIAGLFSNEDHLADDLLAASKRTGELLWKLPLYLDYKENFKSEIADLVNHGGRDASSMKGALFLHEFVGDTPWAHLDIAGTAYLSKPKYYQTTKATGFGLRLLIDFFEEKSLS